MKVRDHCALAAQLLLAGYGGGSRLGSQERRRWGPPFVRPIEAASSGSRYVRPLMIYFPSSLVTEIITHELILPRDIPVDFASIGGLDGIISSLQESVIAPLCYPQLFGNKSGLLGAPKGVLLYGPPGTGESRCFCPEELKVGAETAMRSSSDVWENAAYRRSASFEPLPDPASSSFRQDHACKGTRQGEWCDVH